MEELFLKQLDFLVDMFPISRLFSFFCTLCRWGGGSELRENGSLSLFLLRPPYFSCLLLHVIPPLLMYTQKLRVSTLKIYLWLLLKQ